VLFECEVFHDLPYQIRIPTLTWGKARDLSSLKLGDDRLNRHSLAG
jgi:hypothetical protein